MKVPRKVTYALLLFLLCLNILVRYPRTPHETDYDGFIFHGMAVSLIQEGHALWVVHPLSYFGLYPLSQPSGSIFLLGSISLSAGLPVEGSILLLDILVVTIGLLGSFALGMEVRRDEVLGLFVAAIFSLSPRFVTSLMWAVAPRALFTALIPVFIWSILRWHHRADSRWIGAVSSVFVLMMAAHRLTVLMGAALMAFILTMILLVVAKTLRIRFASMVLSVPFRRISNVVVFVCFIGVTAVLLVAGGVLASYGTGQLGVGRGIILQMTNFGVSLTRSIGFLSPLVPIGVIVLYRMRVKEFKEPFLLVILLVLIPTLTLRQYTGYYIIPFTALFIGLSLAWILHKINRTSVRVAIAAGAVAVAVGSSVFVVNYDLQSSPYIDDQSYSHGLYVIYSTNGTIVANNGVLGSKLFLVSGHPCLPVGGATTSFQSPELLIFGFVDKDGLRVSPLPFSDLTIDSDTPFSLEGVQAEGDWVQILENTPATIPPRILRTYAPAYIVESWEYPGSYTAYGNTYSSNFILAAHSQDYKVFEVNGQTLWYVGGRR